MVHTILLLKVFDSYVIITHPFSFTGRLRHSFRSGLPSLKNSTISVTIDPKTEPGYGTNPCTPKAKSAVGKNLDDLPVRYLSLTKEVSLYSYQ